MGLQLGSWLYVGLSVGFFVGFAELGELVGLWVDGVFEGAGVDDEGFVGLKVLGVGVGSSVVVANVG